MEQEFNIKARVKVVSGSLVGLEGRVVDLDEGGKIAILLDDTVREIIAENHLSDASEITKEMELDESNIFDHDELTLL